MKRSVALLRVNISFEPVFATFNDEKVLESKLALLCIKNAIHDRLSQVSFHIFDVFTNSGHLVPTDLCQISICYHSLSRARLELILNIQRAYFRNLLRTVPTCNALFEFLY